MTPSAEETMETEEFDLIVLGSGAAGREAARLAGTEHGARVAVVERGRWSGACATVACKPTKQYVTAADLLTDLRVVGADLGIETGEVRFDLAALKARKDWFVGTPESWLARFDLPGVTTVDGDAMLVDARTVRVGDRLLQAERILVATGSRPNVPPIEGIGDVDWLDSTAALELTRVPESLLVVGGGPVGLELGQVFSRFGARVTIVEGGPAIAGRADREAAEELRRALVEEGLDVRTGTVVARVAHDGEGILATLSPQGGGDDERVVVEKVLLASGRAPEVEGLGLEELGVELSRRGIVVDAHQRTSVEGVWAAGDVVAGIQLTPVAAYQGQVAVADMFGHRERRAEYDVVPWAIFTDPEIAAVGLTEDEARERGHDVETSVVPAAVLIRPYYVLPRERTAPGLAKLVFERDTRRVLGLHLVLRGASELIQGYAAALRVGVTVDQLAFGHYAFPTAGEAVHYAAEAAIAGELVGAS